MPNNIPKFISNGDRFTVKYDDKPCTLKIFNAGDIAEEPRKDYCDGIFSEMICFHRRYSIGDDHNYDSPEAFLGSLIRDYVGNAKLIKELREKKLNSRLIFNRRTKMYDLFVPSYISTPLGDSKPSLSLEESFSKEDIEIGYLMDAVIENMSINTMLSALDRCNEIAILPIYLYDHSGLTINTSGFSCPWDSGMIGWIYCTKEEYVKNFCLNKAPKDWKEKAYEMLRSEIHLYDCYLTGNVWVTNFLQRIIMKP